MASATGTHIIHDSVIEGQAYKTLARLVGIDDAVLVPNDIDSGSIALSVFEDTGTTPDTDLVSTNTITNSNGGPGGAQDVLVTALQTDEGWDADSTGYNFQHVYRFTDNANDGSGTALTVQGGQRYRLEYTIDTTGSTAGTDSGPVYLVVILDILSRSGG